MGFLEMIVVIVLIKSIGDVAEQAFKASAVRRSRVPDRVEAELAAIRAEIAALRTSTHDLILSFDSTLHQQERRLESLERRALTEDGSAARSSVSPATPVGERSAPRISRPMRRHV